MDVGSTAPSRQIVQPKSLQLPDTEEEGDEEGRENCPETGAAACSGPYRAVSDGRKGELTTIVSSPELS